MWLNRLWNGNKMPMKSLTWFSDTLMVSITFKIRRPVMKNVQLRAQLNGQLNNELNVNPNKQLHVNRKKFASHRCQVCIHFISKQNLMEYYYFFFNIVQLYFSFIHGIGLSRWPNTIFDGTTSSSARGIKEDYKETKHCMRIITGFTTWARCFSNSKDFTCRIQNCIDIRKFEQSTENGQQTSRTKFGPIYWQLNAKKQR